MKLMKHLAIAALLATLIPLGSASAGHDRDPERMQKELGLNDSQAQQVRTIMKEQSDKRRALEEETRQRLSKVLNAEQMERMEKHADKRKGRRGERMGDRIAEELGLNAEQKVAVEKIFSETKGEYEAMEKSELNQEQKRARMEALHAGTREKMAKVLNAEQLARFDEMHTRHMRHKDRMGKHSHAGSESDAAPSAESN